VKKVTLLTLTLVLALVTALVAVPAQAATDSEIQEAIERGVLWLVDQQKNDGSWGPGGPDDTGRVAETGLAVVKLEDRAFEQGKTPFDDDYEYKQEVIDGLNFIFTTAASDTCGTHFVTPGTTRYTYETGIAMMAIAAGGDMTRVVPALGSIIDGDTFAEVLTANVAYLENSQDQAGNGGWAYGCPPAGNPDNSNAGYAVLGLSYAYDAGIPIPASVTTSLDVWIDYIQNDQGAADDGTMDTPDGGSGYTTAANWVNLLKTGNLLSEMALVGDGLPDQRVQDAIAYIGNHWNDVDENEGWQWTGPVSQYQTCYTLMKGLAYMGVPMSGIPGVADWYQDLADVIVAEQVVVPPDMGYWPDSPAYVHTNDVWGTMAGETLSTLWALLVLELIAPPPVVGGEVYAVDVPAASVADVGTESGISALWIGSGLALIVLIGGGVFILRRQRAN
jgi:hypothetical protein